MSLAAVAERETPTRIRALERKLRTMEDTVARLTNLRRGYPRTDSSLVNRAFLVSHTATANQSNSYVIGEAISTTGTSHTLANTPVATTAVALYLNGQRLQQVASGNETNTSYSISGASITTGRSVAAADDLVADYQFAATVQTLTLGEAITSTGTTHSLANTPNSNAEVSLFLNGQRLEQTASGPTFTQYTISGTTITTGRSVTAADDLVADYITA